MKESLKEFFSGKNPEDSWRRKFLKEIREINEEIAEWTFEGIPERIQ